MNRREFSQTAAGLLTATVADRAPASADEPSAIPALMPRDESGHRFVLYSDCCSGTPGKTTAANLQRVNAMVARIRPQPEFIAFPGDAIRGYTKDYVELRRQWDYCLGTEMKWLGVTCPREWYHSLSGDLLVLRRRQDSLWSWWSVAQGAVQPHAIVELRQRP